MEKKLRTLVSEYQKSTRAAVELLQESGIPMPLTAQKWEDTTIPCHGELKGGVTYFKHGIGCEVEMPSGTVDFDFGEMGEIDGFDLWRLNKFIRPHLPQYGFESTDEIEASFEKAVKAGSIKSINFGPYYVTAEKRVLAIELPIIFKNDILPHRDQDDILNLYANSFEVAHFMRKTYEQLSIKSRAGKRLTKNESASVRSYFLAWLGFLAVTCEGLQAFSIQKCLENNRPDSFKELAGKCKALVKLVNRHREALKDFRNNVFHPRRDIKPVLRFALDDDGRLQWAIEIHTAFSDFFSHYRAACEVHYLMNARGEESRIRESRSKRQ